MRIFLVFTLISLNTFACFDQTSSSLVKNKYAKNFEIYVDKSNNYLLKVIPNLDFLNKEFVYEFTANKNSKCKNAFEFRSLKKIALTTTSQAFAINELDGWERVKGIVGRKYLVNLKNINQVEELGFPFNYEKLLKIKSDLLLTYYTGLSELDTLKKLKELKVPTVLIYEFLEANPLARAEWIKVFGIILNKFEKSKKYFNQVEQNYTLIKKSAKNLKEKTVLLGYMMGEKWTHPGGNSDFVNLLKDIKVKTLFKSTSKNQDFLSFEEVLTKAMNVEYWLPLNNWKNKNDLMLDPIGYSRFFNGFKAIKIYNNTKVVNKFGGNAYWEEATFRPDFLLGDLLKLFYSEKESLRWFVKLNE